jgi:hypothetical protein
LQRRRFEALDLYDNLAAARGPDTEMDATIGLRLGSDRQTPDRTRLGRDQTFQNGGLGRRRELLPLLREEDA